MTQTVIETPAPAAITAQRATRRPAPYAYDVLPTRLGRLALSVDAEGCLVHIAFLDGDKRPDALRWLAIAAASRPRDRARLAAAREQIGAYLAGRRQQFDLKLAPRGSDFQRAVWRWLLDIPFGDTQTYGQIATALARPRSARAVGRAVGQNPLPIVIPCHRVIGAGGSLTGFAGGLAMKRVLLDLEAGTQPLAKTTLACG